MTNFYFSFLFFSSFCCMSFMIACGQAGSHKNTFDSENPVMSRQKHQTDSSREISLLFLGDIMQHDLQIESAYYQEKGSYDFSSQFENVSPIFDSTDIVVGNFEVTLSGPPYKGYPKFSSPDALARAVKDAGIDYLAFANNHVFDYGRDGFVRTLRTLDSLQFKRTGAFLNKRDKAEKHPMVIEQKGFKIAVYNYTYGVNGGSGQSIVNHIDSAVIKRDLQESMNDGYDARIIFMHWGEEYERLPNAEQLAYEKFCCENGADIVIGAHPHVIQPMKFYNFTDSAGNTKKVLTAYSLGNFVSNYATWRYCDGGAMIRFKLRKTGNSSEVEILDPEYHLVWVYRPYRKGKLRRYSVLPIKDFENDPKITGEFKRLMQRFIKDSRSHLKQHNENVPEAD